MLVEPEHNHEVTKEAYILHPKNRRLPKIAAKEIDEHFNTDCKATKVALLMSQKYNKFVLAKDLHNMRTIRRTTGETESQKLKEAIDAQIKIDGNKNYFHFIQNEEKTEIYGVFYQNQNMKNNFKTFGEITFNDGTYGLNKNTYPCILFVQSGFN